MHVIDFGQEPDGLLYIAMEFLDGMDLFRVIQSDWPLPLERVVDILMQTLGVLAAAHDQGIIHRDLKPENIMILRRQDDEGTVRDTVKVCDFGIAKITDPAPQVEKKGNIIPSAKLTTQGIVVGTPEYMSPEQGKGEKLDPRSDLYSVGVILYQLLTGRVPFDAETAIGVVLKHVTEEPVPPRKINPAADPRLEAICLRAMKKRPDDRYANARDMRADLRAILGPDVPVPIPVTARNVDDEMTRAKTEQIDSGGVRAVTGPTPSKLTPAGTAAVSAQRRSGGVFVLAALIALAIGAGATFLVMRERMKPQQPTTRLTADPDSESAACQPAI
jgi:serine/threonine-protein kinase